MKKQLLAILLAFTLVFCLGGCSFLRGDDAGDNPEQDAEEEIEEENPEYPVELADGTVIDSRPARLVSLSPALTEKLCDLGLEERLCGVSDYCDYPAAVSSKPKCGTAQLLNLEAVEAESPQVVLTEVALSQSDMEALAALEIAVVVLPRANSTDELMERYKTMMMICEGTYTGAEIGEKFCEGFMDELDALSQKYQARTAETGRKPALYLRMLDFTVATGDTLENELMEKIGLDNIAAFYTGWQIPSEETGNSAVQSAFQTLQVMYMDERYVTIKMLEQNAYYKPLPATLQDLYLYIDCTVFERQSLRMLDELEKMGEYAYPSAEEPAVEAEEPDAA